MSKIKNMITNRLNIKIIEKFVAATIVVAISFSVCSASLVKSATLSDADLTKDEILAMKIDGDRDTGMTYPEVDTTNMGYNIKRTMRLLETSTAEHPNTVRIVLYGQSIIQSDNDWTKWLHYYLQQRYPTANIIWNNIAIGGFSSDLLKYMVECDMKDLYPDLVIYCDYGPYDGFVKVVRYLREKTTSEFMFMTDHYTGSSGGIDSNAEQNSTEFIPKICKEFGCEITDVRTYFKKYCEINNVEPNTYIREDGVHLADMGEVLMYRLMKQMFVYKEADEKDKALSTVSHLSVGEGKDIQWKDGTLEVPVMGNRFEVVTGSANTNEAEVYVDGLKPSENVECYNYTRICDREFWLMGGFLRGTLMKVPQVEDWTLTFTEADAAKTSFAYTLSGSKTGNDGMGSEKKVFLSDSGVWKLDPSEIFTGSVGYTDLDGTSKTGFYSVGNTFHFSTYLNGTDTFQSGKDENILLATGFNNVRSKLSIKAKASDKTPDIKEIIVYSPCVYEDVVKKPTGIKLKDNTKWIEGKTMPDSLVVAEIGDKSYRVEADMDGAFIIKMNSCVTAGKKVKVHTEFMNKASDDVILTSKPRTPSVKKVTVKSKNIEGKASPKAVVTIKISGRKFTARTNKKGVYKLSLKKSARKKLKAGQKITVVAKVNKISSAKKTVKVKKK